MQLNRLSLGNGLWTALTEARKSSVAPNQGIHLILELQSDDGTAIKAVDVTPELDGKMYAAGITMATTVMESGEFDGFRVESNYGALLTRDNAHKHLIFKRPEFEFRRSIDPIVLPGDPAMKAD